MSATLIEGFGPAAFQLRDALFQFFETRAGAHEHLRLRVEFLARDEVELGEALLEHRLHVLFDVLRRRIAKQFAHFLLKVVEYVVGLLHRFLPCAQIMCIHR